MVEDEGAWLERACREVESQGKRILLQGLVRLANASLAATKYKVFHKRRFSKRKDAPIVPMYSITVCAYYSSSSGGVLEIHLEAFHFVVTASILPLDTPIRSACMNSVCNSSHAYLSIGTFYCLPSKLKWFVL